MEPEFYDESRHYARIADWWSKHKWPIVPPRALPKLGLVIVEGDTQLCCGFLYRSDSSIAWIEFIVVNPMASVRLRYRALDMLIECLTEHAKNMGYESVFSSLQSKGLMRKFEKAGYIKTDQTMTNMIRRF